MQVLINDLLSLSLISGNQAFVHYSIQSIFEDVLRVLEHKIEEKDVSIEAPALPAGDAERAVIQTVNGQVLGTVLVDGFVRAAYKLLIGKGTTRLTISAPRKW